MIVNADDFGLCSGVNRAVKRAHHDGILTSATLMCNMPGALEAVEIAGDMNSLGVGVHLNLLEGKPLCRTEEVGILLNNEGEFECSASQIAIKSLFSGKVRRAIEVELAAQIEWAIAHGVSPTHLDSHKHVHAFPTIYKIVVRLAERFGIGAIRWPWEPKEICGCNWPLVMKGGKTRALKVRTMARLDRWSCDKYIRNDVFLGLAHTGQVDQAFWNAFAGQNFAGVVEIMTHPSYADGLDAEKTRLIAEREVELEALCSDDAKRAVSDANVELVHYGMAK